MELGKAECRFTDQVSCPAAGSTFWLYCCHLAVGVCGCGAVLNAGSNCSTLVVKQKLPGVYVQPSYRSALSKFKFNFENFNNYVVLILPLEKTLSLAVWFGVIFIRHGLYQDGVFKFTVYIPDNYPDGDCPVSGCGCVSWVFLLLCCFQCGSLLKELTSVKASVPASFLLL